VRLEPLGREHVGELWRSAEAADPSWAYLRYGPFTTESGLLERVIELAGQADQPFWAVRPQSRLAQGWLSLCDIFTRSCSAADSAFAE
jgi:hypothetical protein